MCRSGWLVLVISLAACNKKSSDPNARRSASEQDKADVSAALDRLDKLAAKPTPPPSGKIEGKLDVNSTIVVPADPATRSAYFTDRRGKRPWWSNEMLMRELLNYTGGTPYPGGGAGYVAWLTSAKHLAVVRTTELVLPVAKVGTFTPGQVTGEVHVYEIASEKYLGGAWFTATSSDKVTFIEHDEYPQSKVDDDFRDKASAAIQKAWTAGGLPPPPPPAARVDPPLEVKLPAGWQSRPSAKAGVMLSAVKGKDTPAMMQVFLSRLAIPVPFDTDALCEQVASAYAEGLNGKVTSDARAHKATDDERATCNFTVDHDGRVAWVTVIDATEGAPLMFQCDAPNLKNAPPDCEAIWRAIDLP